MAIMHLYKMNGTREIFLLSFQPSPLCVSIVAPKFSQFVALHFSYPYQIEIT